MCPFVRWIWNNTKDVKPIPFDESDYTWEVTVSGADNQSFNSWYYKPCNEYTGNGLLEQMVSGGEPT